MKRIAFVGNPNVGKSALINAISGSNFKVGNWTGVTIEKKEAEFVRDGEMYNFIDLPGIYSLDTKSKEEEITANYLNNENVDVILNVVDSTNLERNLYLTMMLRELQKPMILVLNFEDELEKMGYNLDITKLSKYLNMPVVLTSAVNKSGIDQIFHVIDDMYEQIGHIHHTHFDYSQHHNHHKHKEHRDVNIDDLLHDVDDSRRELVAHSIYYGDIFDKAYAKLYNQIKPVNLTNYSTSKVVVSLLEGNTALRANFTADILAEVDCEIEVIEEDTGEDSKSAISSYRYNVIKKILERVLKKTDVSRLRSTKKIDDILLNKYLSLPIFLLVAFLFLNIVIKGAAPFQDWVDGFANDFIGKYLGILIQDMPNWFQSLMLDGILAGVGGVLTFLPLMAFLSFFLAILEETGYMARIAFLIDRIMRKFGVNGRSFISMLLGFGCTVPAIYSTRTIQDERARKITAFMVPFMSCGAKLPVYSLFIAAFFSAYAGVAIFAIYVFNIVFAVIIVTILNLFGVFKGEEEKSFMIELPPYRIPTIRVLLKKVRFELKGYIHKTFTIIFAVLVILWGMAYFPNGDVQTSYMSSFGKTFQPLYQPTGFADDWRMVASIPGSIAAKETVVGFISQVFEVEEVDNEEIEETTFIQDLADQAEGLAVAVKDSVVGVFDFSLGEEEAATGTVAAIQSVFGTDALGTLRAVSFVLYIMLLIPCIAGINAVRVEFGKKYFIYDSLFRLIFPYIVSVLVFQIGSLIIK